MNEVICVKCSSKNVRRNGITKDGRQRYKCKDCGREFRGNVPIVPLTIQEKKFILFYNLNFGVSAEDIAGHIRKPLFSVTDYLKRHKERAKKCTSTKR